MTKEKKEVTSYDKANGPPGVPFFPDSPQGEKFRRKKMEGNGKANTKQQRWTDLKGTWQQAKHGELYSDLKLTGPCRQIK